MARGKAANIKALKRALVAGYPVIVIDSWEEEQVLASLEGLQRSIFPAQEHLHLWDVQRGLYCGSNVICPGPDPEPALASLENVSGPGFFVFRDLCSFLEQPLIARAIRSIYSRFRGQNRFLIIVGTEINIPAALRRELHLLIFQLPDTEELAGIFDRTVETLAQRGIPCELSPLQREHAVIALKGLTANEAQYCLNKVFWGLNALSGEVIPALQDEKQQVASKLSIVEYVRTTNSIDDVGGLENLKEWLQKRKRLFSAEAAAAGIRPPRGLLMMGISGCGKSLSVKAISTLWDLPLFRLDMNQVYSGLYGTPEATFHRAIRSVEAMAPAILWIDEIEGGISSNAMKDGGTGSHIFSAFLTWMQEKSADVFVAATANRIDLLPAEIIRKGRFDQVFFMDLPNDNEREAIFRVHLRRSGVPLEKFDIPLLSVATEYWNGAEIEHAVEAAIIEAFDRQQPLMQDDLYTIIRNTVPLARTMAEQIKFIKGWAGERAVSASRSDSNGHDNHG